MYLGVVLELLLLTYLDGDLEIFLQEVVKASESGILVTNNVTFTSSWSFGQSLFFAATLLTTIGKTDDTMLTQ